MRLDKAIITPILIIVLLALCLLGNAFQLLLLPLSLVSTRIRFYSNSLMAECVWRLCNWIFWYAGGRLVVRGPENICPSESAFVVSNHRSIGDFFLIHEVAIRANMLGYCRYFAKDSVKWIPLFGWGIRLMGMIMLKRDWARDRRRIVSTFGLYTKHILPLWLISYSEGSRWSPKKAEAASEYAVASGRPPLDHVLLPRTKGFVASINALRDRIKAVYDLTLVYKKGSRLAVPPYYDFLLGNLSGYVFEVHVQRFPVEDLPVDDGELAEWLHNRFQNKDKLLQSIYQ